MSNIREYMDKNPAAGWLVIAPIMLVAAFMLWRHFRGPNPQGEPVFFYDLNTKRLVVSRSRDISPRLDSPTQYAYPDGEAGSVVRANIWACGDGDVRLEGGMTVEDIEAAGARLVSLQRTPTPLLEDLRRSRQGQAQDQADESRRVDVQITLVSGPDGENWFSADGGKAMALQNVLFTMCDGDTPRFIQP